MIQNDGGSGNIKISYPAKLGIWETILTGTADATWMFRNREGIRTENDGIALNLFKMADYGIPYGYSPVILAIKKVVSENEGDYARFLEATKKGYLFAKENAIEAVSCFAPFVVQQDKNIDLIASQEFTSPFYGTMDTWGVLDKQKVKENLDWLVKNKLEERSFTVEELVVSGLV